MNRRILTLSISLLILATSCSQPSVSTTQAKLCTSLAELKASVATLKSLSPSSTVGDFKQAKADVKKDWEKVKTNASALGNAKSEALDRSYKDLEKAVNSVSNRATLSEGASSIQDEVTAVTTAQDQFYSGLQCQ